MRHRCVWQAYKQKLTLGPKKQWIVLKKVPKNDYAGEATSATQSVVHPTTKTLERSEKMKKVACFPPFSSFFPNALSTLNESRPLRLFLIKTVCRWAHSIP